MRVGQVIRLAPEAIEEYERLHAEVWPSVLDRITRSGIRNYSIFRYGTLLFATFDFVGDDFAAAMAAMAADSETRRWWALCEPMQKPVDEHEPGEWWHTVPEIFHTQ